MADYASDPLYNEALAGISLAEKGELTGIAEERERGLRTFSEGEEAQRRAEPFAYKTIDNTANRQGQLESGFEAGRTGRQESTFAAQRTARIKAKEEEEGSEKQHEERVRNKALFGQHEQVRLAEERAAKAITEKPQTGTTYPIPPAQQMAIAEGVPPGPGGVVPYESQKVRVGLPPRKSYVPKGR